MEPFSLTRGNSCLVLAMPHVGTFVPSDIWQRLNARGRELADTDWHIDQLYAGLMPDATVIRANVHRYVIDANRNPSGDSLYPGQNTTGLCPTTDFDGAPIYHPGKEPDAVEIARRRATFHAPYHAALRAELDRVKRQHGVAVLYDCHSIRSHIPFLFEGTLPDFNIGTNGGVTCAPEMQEVAVAVCGSAPGFTSVLTGRFKGGWTTRHYADPTNGFHALQMELAQSTHLETEAAPFTLSPAKAARIRPHLKALLETLVALASSARKEI